MKEFQRSELHAGVSSGEAIRSDHDIEAVKLRIAAALEEDGPSADPEADLSPVFKLLREPKLPVLQRENRARLLMQTPNRVYFYWSLKNNPFQILRRVFGDDTGSYALVAKLINTTRGTEQIHLIDAEGNWWFSVEPDSTYHAEVGFYAPNRPYFRAVFSNSITTPRKSPSPRTAADADWRIGAEKFAAVLDVAGFTQDAFDVAITGDDDERAVSASYAAAERLTGLPAERFRDVDPDDIRYALTLVGMGATLEELRFRISERLFDILQSVIDRVNRRNAFNALAAEFEIDDDRLAAFDDDAGLAIPNSLSMPRRGSLRPLPRPTSTGRVG